MNYFRNPNSGWVYKVDQYGKNMLEIVNGARCIIPVCDIPSVAVPLDCTDEEAWKLVEGKANDNVVCG